MASVNCTCGNTTLKCESCHSTMVMIVHDTPTYKCPVHTDQYFDDQEWPKCFVCGEDSLLGGEADVDIDRRLIQEKPLLLA